MSNVPEQAVGSTTMPDAAKDADGWAKRLRSAIVKIDSV